MDNTYIISIVTFTYGLAMVCYAAGLIFKREQINKAGSLITLLAVTGNLAAIIYRWIESYQLGMGHAPFANMYESLVFFAFSIGLIYLVMELRFKTRALGAPAILMAFIVLAYASLSPGIDQKIQPLIPALQSNWLIAHVITCFLGYAAFAIAFGISALYLFLRQRQEIPATATETSSPGLPRTQVLDDLIYQTVSFGFFFLSIGIITGAVWANSAWGRYWGWDPKETWSLITWFVYAILLHARLVRGWRGKAIAWIAIAGFAAVIFTYFGVNLLPGLHSYQ